MRKIKTTLATSLAPMGKKYRALPKPDDPIAPLFAGTLEACLWYPERLVWPNSWVAHIPFAFWLISALRPRLLVELGVYTGNSYAAFCQAVQRMRLPTRCFGVDTWEGDPHTGFYGEDIYTEITTWHDARHANFSRLVRSTFDEAVGKFSSGTIDLLHIDGLHNYEAVRHDFEAWRSRLSSKAIVLLHDTNVREHDFGVWQLWEELSTQYPSFEFVHGHGLGVLGVGADLPATVRLLFEAAGNTVQLAQTRNFFARLGNPLMHEVLLDAVRGERDAAIAREAEARRQVEFVRNDAAAKAAAEAQLAAILSSTTWRATMWLRNTVANRPTLRRTLRRCAKLAWWTLTLQLPGRLIDRCQQSARRECPDPPALADAEVLEKARFTQRARADLHAFLAAGRRLVIPVEEVPDISVIVVLWNQAHLTLRCLRALQNQHGVAIEVILIDNASSDETPALLSRVEGVRVLRRNTNEGFVVGCNWGARAARGRVLLLLNSDAFVRPGAFAAAVTTLDSAPDVGAVGGRLVLPTGRLQEAGSIIWSDGSTAGYGRGLDPSASEAMFRREVDYCSAAFLLTPRALWNRLDGFDEIYSPAYYEEADYCMRLRAAGYRVIYEPAAVADHYEFGSRTKEYQTAQKTRRNRKIFRDRHAEILRSVHLPPCETNLLAARGCRTPVRRHLLVIDNEVPLGSLGSGYPRVREMLAAAVAMGWSVTFFPLHHVEIDWSAARREIPWEVEIIAGRGTSGLAGFLRERQGHYDLVMVSRPDNMRLVREALHHLPDVFDGSRLIYDAEALFANREITKAAIDGRTYSVAEAEALIGAEIAVAEGADAIVCVNESEADTFRTRQSAPVYVLSHSVEPADVAPSFRERAGFLFIGRLLEREAPNWLGLRWFIRECWPAIRASQPKAVLSVVGHLHPDHADLEAPGVRLLGPARDLRPHYDAARVFIAPIRFGAGIPIKILEATAAGLPTAGTRLMAHQLEWNPGIDMIADDGAQELAAASATLHDDAGIWEAMRVAARRRLENAYSAEAFQKGLRDLLVGLTPPSLRSARRCLPTS
jgi:O-antigen biosynthesis protein